LDAHIAKVYVKILKISWHAKHFIGEKNLHILTKRSFFDQKNVTYASKKQISNIKHLRKNKKI